MVCLLIALSFLTLTLPFPIYRWTVNGRNPWANLLLLINSGANSAVYIARGDYKLRRRLSKLKSTKIIEKSDDNKYY